MINLGTTLLTDSTTAVCFSVWEWLTFGGGCGGNWWISAWDGMVLPGTNQRLTHQWFAKGAAKPQLAHHRPDHSFAPRRNLPTGRLRYKVDMTSTRVNIYPHLSYLYLCIYIQSLTNIYRENRYVLEERSLPLPN